MEKSLAQIGYEATEAISSCRVPWGNLTHGTTLQQAEAFAAAVEAEVLKRQTVAPQYYVTAERPPTRGDGNQDGYVLAFGRMNVEADALWRPCFPAFINSAPAVFKYWQPMPLAPVSPDDAAFEKALTAAGFDPSTYNAEGLRELRSLFDAGAAFARRDNKPA